MSQFWHFRMRWWKFTKFLMSFSKPQVSFSSNFASLSNVMKDNSSIFLGQKLPEKTNQSANFWDFWELGSKFTKFLSFFETANQFSFKFFYQSWVSVPSNITPLYFLSWSIVYFGQKQPIKVQIFEIFESSDQNLITFSCQFWTSQFLFKFASFFIVITHNSPVNFKLINVLLGIKVHHKSPNCDSQLLRALVKICQIPQVIFQTTIQLFFKFCITL